MRRALVWGAAAVVLAAAIWLIDAETFWRPLLAVVPVVVYAVVLLVRVIMAPTGGIREAVAPALRGLDDVQGLSLGRPEPTPVTYGTDDGTVAARVVDRPDPFDGLVDGQPATG